MSDRDLQPQEPQDLVPEEEYYEEDYALSSEVEQNIVKIGIFFAGSVPLVGLTQLVGLGMSGFVGGAVAAAILAAIPTSWYKRVPGAQYVIAQISVFHWRRILALALNQDTVIAGEIEAKTVDADPAPKKTNGTETNETVPSQQETEREQSEDETLFSLKLNTNTSGVRRVTVNEIVAHVEPNSYRIFLGRSLTKPKHPAVPVNIYKQHFRIIGSSQRGKSSWVAAFLEIVTRTHDKKHVLLALLDKENQTSKLFAHLPHVARMKVGNDIIKLHARDDEEVLLHLMYLIAVMKERYKLSKTEIVQQPIILIYIEEFLLLKNHFKAEMRKAKAMKAESKEAEAFKTKAITDYENLIYSITTLAGQGLKVRMQLLLCAQVDYTDDDFREAQANISCGISLCVPLQAAMAAGFKQVELLQRNFKDNGIGQGVVEIPGCDDLILAPDFPLEERLIALEAEEDQGQAPVSLQEYRREVATSAVGYEGPARTGVAPSSKWNEVATSVNRGAATSVPTSEFGEVATSETRTTENGRNGSTGQTKWNRSGAPLRELSERERWIGELFFGPRRLNPTAIMKEVFPEAKGGDAYQKAAAEVADAIRAYSEAMQQA